MHANNEMGTIHPIAEIGKITKIRYIKTSRNIFTHFGQT
jgi:cysteine sulfinate desulfinase/cysteine desulfurase-like protein